MTTKLAKWLSKRGCSYVRLCVVLLLSALKAGKRSIGKNSSQLVQVNMNSATAIGSGFPALWFDLLEGFYDFEEYE